MDTPEKVRENRLRRMIYRRGYRFAKSRVRDPNALGYGRVRIEAKDGREAEGFESPDGRGLTLDELAERLGDGGWAVYRLYAADGTLLYVGSSNDPRDRWSALSCGNAWFAEVDRKAVTWYPAEEEARAIEAAAVLSESPVHNVKLRSSDLTERVVIRMTPREVAELDAARGQVSRSEWLRRSLLEAPPRQSGQYSTDTLPLPAAGGCQQGSELIVISARINASLFAAVEKARGDVPRPTWIGEAIAAQCAPKPGNCKHPNLRMAKGVCPDCTTYVAKK